MSATLILAVFDFDGTLIEGDSLPRFLLLVAGVLRFASAAIEALAFALAGLIWRQPADPAFRTVFKERLMLRLLIGRKLSRLKPAMLKLRRSLRWKDRMRKALLDHAAEGHHIVIASGALDIYLPELLDGLPHHALLCTKMEISNGRLTGSMEGGNCVRQRKAELVRDYIAAHGPFADSFGYGNAPHDLPMLALVRHRIVV